jgi:hypothetical protein
MSLLGWPSTILVSVGEIGERIDYMSFERNRVAVLPEIDCDDLTREHWRRKAGAMTTEGRGIVPDIRATRLCR